MNDKIGFNVSELDDHELARLEKILRRNPPDRKQARESIISKVDSLDLSQLTPKERNHMEKMLRMEMCNRKTMPGGIDTSKVTEEEWRDIFDQPDYMRYPDPQENKGSTIEFPLRPAEFFRHARHSLRQKLKRSKQDRKQILEEFFASSVSDNMIMLQTMRLWLDKMFIDHSGSNFQDVFIGGYGTINALKEKKERHVIGLFEALGRIESIPISIGKVGQLNLAGAQQVNNDLQKSPGEEIEAEAEDAS